MTFPVIMEHPTYTCKLPALNKEVKFRPFLEKERKLLLMVAANENPELKDMINVLKQIAKSCLIDEIDIDNLAGIDLQFLFLNIRARSVNEIIERNFICANDVIVNEKVTEKCGNIMQINVNLLEDVIVENLNNENKLIELSPTVKIKLKYPTLRTDEYTDEYQAIISCIDYVGNAEQVYYAKDYSEQELEEFLYHLNSQQFGKIESFFNNLPVLRSIKKHKCEKCGFMHDTVVEGLQSFFD